MHDTRIAGSTRLVGLFGWPVAHSVSPVFQNHLFRHYGLDFAYVPLPVPPERLHAALQAVRACGFAGANVTIPHKRQVLHFCDRISDLSQAVGAVNTLYVQDGLWCGTTTDADGFFRAVGTLDSAAAEGHVVVLGNGGVARTIAYALAMRGTCRSLTLAGRNTQRVSLLAAEVAVSTGFAVQAAGLGDPGFAGIMKECTLCVNGTSAGMHPNSDVSPIPATLLHRGLLVFDTVYNPPRTRLMVEAESAGCRVENGLKMLVYQGLASFRLWTGIEPDETLIDIPALQNLISGR
jgi:shikimate dehydrogenase